MTAGRDPLAAKCGHTVQDGLLRCHLELLTRILDVDEISGMVSSSAQYPLRQIFLNRGLEGCVSLLALL